MDKYTIQQGDTLSNIASKYGTTVQALQSANQIQNPNLIKAGANLVIPSQSIKADAISTVKPFTVPQQPKSNIDNYATSFTDSITNLQSSYDKSQEKVSSNQSDLLNIYKQLEGQTADTLAEESKVGLPSIDAELTSLEAEKSRLTTQYINAIKQREAQGGVAAVVGADQKRILAQSASDIGLLDAEITAKRGQYKLALDKVARAIDIKYEPIKQRLETLKQIYEINKDNLSRDDKNLLEAKNKQWDLDLKKIEKQMEDEKGVQSIALEIAKNGGNPSIVKDSKNVMEAINKAGSMLSTPTTELVKIGDGAMLIDKRTGKVLNKYGSLPGSSSTSGVISPTNKYAGVVNTILASGKFTKDQANAVRTAIQNGEDPVTVIKNNAKNTMNATTAGKLEAAESARDAFNDLATALSAFYAANGDTSYIKGNFEKINNRLGKVKDPELVQLAVQVQGAIQSYRNAISGTAYSEQEGRDITSIFPGINKSEELNNAIINGRKKLFDSTIDAAYRSTIGSAYDSLKNANVVLAKENLSDRDFVEKALTKQGIKYEQIINDVPPGKIPVLDNATGEVGFLPINEFNSNYTKL